MKKKYILKKSLLIKFKRAFFIRKTSLFYKNKKNKKTFYLNNIYFGFVTIKND